MTREERFEWMRKRQAARQSATPKKRRARSAEARRFNDRLRFDRCQFWDEGQERSLIPSIWPAIEEHCRKYGVPAGFRLVEWEQRRGYR